ncbi:hypothetical protein PsorP6_005722 [Peronosclerospora sorghi]|uniref:Uncharacterized protein n=1 Tax=Peronosclerospora sorghi TaxID=230839 RepID=A0ACC0W373_9STRA|nr:hypothetical protein PsorP6_005722 [Peronosclerospora sorghi]
MFELVSVRLNQENILHAIASSQSSAAPITMIPSQRDRACRASPRYLDQDDSLPALLRLFHCHLESNLSAVFTSGSARSLPGSTRQLILEATRFKPITPDSLVDPQPQHEPDTTFLDNRKRPSMFRTLSSYDDTPVRTVWRDTGVLAKCCVGFTSLVWRPASPRLVAARREQREPVDDDGGTGPLCPRTSSTSFAHGDARDAGPGRDAPLCRDSLELPPRRRLVPSSHPPFAVFLSACASISSSSSTLSDQAGPPSVRELAAFIKRILKLSKTDAECIIMTLVCLERLLTATSGRLENQRATWLLMVFYYRTWR